ncbi:hypothetical protein [Streptomyces sp. NPDC056600]|uniref:hypothetical protein n=1 Tax=Streptomyces sp. NPDC056600 TaxID=3345874 RepID=UPI0036B63B28
MTANQKCLRREWAAFGRPARWAALALCVLVVVACGLLPAFGSRVSCDDPCPARPTGPDGSPVDDQFSFLHRDLGERGSITVRMTGMTGTITYPPPDHDRIVPGLAPWAKAGIIVKDGVRQGSPYAALMLSGHHGVRMQHGYRHDVAGRAGGVSATSPRWLRLTRAGDTVTGFESPDGERWTRVGAVRLPGLPSTVQVGLFAASPGDLTLRPAGLGGTTQQVRFTQASGVFDHVGLEGATAGGWRWDAVGEMNRTDWEKYHLPSGAVERGGRITVTGIGDIGPRDTEGARPAERTLVGLPLGLLVLLVVAVRFAASRDGGTPLVRRVLAARAAVVGAVTFVTGLLAVGVVLPLGVAVLESNGVAVPAVSASTEVRVVVATAAALALAAVFTVALGSLLRRTWLALGAAVLTIVVPYLVASVPLLSDEVSRWLLRVTPAAGFAAQQTLVEHRHVIAHYAPATGYFPLPWWAGLAVLAAYAVASLWLAARRLPRGSEDAAHESVGAPGTPVGA